MVAVVTKRDSYVRGQSVVATKWDSLVRGRRRNRYAPYRAPYVADRDTVVRLTVRLDSVRVKATTVVSFLITGNCFRKEK